MLSERVRMTTETPGQWVRQPCRALLIDNYDSYSFNLYHLIAKVTNCEPILVQNDDFEGNWDLLMAALGGPEAFQCIVVGPGPGTPENKRDLGLSEAAVRREDIGVPVLGVCLGMQAIAHVYGGRVVRAPRPMHGRLSSVIKIGRQSKLFENIQFPFDVVRYHSLCVEMAGAGEENLLVTARTTDDDVIMGLEHRTRMLYGVQFHPESICAGKAGEQIMSNFVNLACQVELMSKVIPRSIKRIKSEHVGNSLNGRSRVSLRIEMLESPKASAEDVYEALFKTCPYRAWFDSAMEHPRRGKFSILCKQSDFGVGDRIEFFVDPNHRRMDLNASHDMLRDAGDCILNVYGRSGEGVWSLQRQRNGRGCEPFSHLNNVLSNLKPSTVAFKDVERNVSSTGTSFEVVPFDFCCGYVGVLGYGLRKLCGVKETKDESIEIVQPVPVTGLPDSAFFFCDQSVVFDHATKRAYVLTLCGANPEQQQEQTAWAKSALDLLRQPQPPAIIPDCALDSPIQLVPRRSSEEYVADVNACLEKIIEGETYEVCLTTQLTAKGRSVDANTLYRTLRRNNPAPFCALYVFGETFALCSSSPERFLRVDGSGVVESRPIKGTVARDADPDRDEEKRLLLASSEKDRSENMMIVDLVRNDLGRVCEVGTVRVPDLFVVESFRTVHQLVSTIQGDLRPGLTAVDAARAAFPPGSMTGAPKERTMQIIDSIEPQERGFYSGALGFFSASGAADFNVIIRTAVVQKDSVSVGAGGAIVALSDPVLEQQEMVLKVKALGACFEIIG